MAKMPQGWDTPNRSLASPKDQAADALLEAGIDRAEEIVFDGRVHRFHTEGDDRNEKSGWYIFYGDNLPAGSYGNWRTNFSRNWHAMTDHVLTQEERELLEIAYERARQEREKQDRLRHAQAAQKAAAIWNACSPADPGHPYLQKKSVQPYGLKQNQKGQLVMPIYIGDRLASLQYISGDGTKRFLPDGETGGGYFVIPPASKTAREIYVVEGYATGASVHRATEAAVVVALNAGNLSRVGQALRTRNPAAALVFVGDNDKSGVGQKAASEAARLCGARVIIPPKDDPDSSVDANDYAAAGGDLKGLLEEHCEPWLLPLSEFCKKPAPIRWLIKNWVQEEAAMMVFGASGTGKTFFVLDQALSIASSEIDDWHGFKVKHVPVVYLAGEGHFGLRARIAGWLAYKNVSGADMLISTSADDLNKPGGVEKVIAEISRYDKQPGLIIIDTLNRFMLGDENKADDTRTFLDACARLTNQFHCTVMIVHHTGVNPDAKDRARGSSAWKGAMDIEIMIDKQRGNPRTTVRQTKSKDAEIQPDLFLEQTQIAIPGWRDEDGNPVTTVVLETADGPSEPEEKPLTKQQQFGLDTYREAAATVGTLDSEGRFVGVGGDEWRDVFCARSTLDNERSKERAFRRTRTELVDLKKVYVQNGYYRLKGTTALLEEKEFAKQLFIISNAD